jgi:transcriptional regulator with XRE-family HTH domain
MNPDHSSAAGETIGQRLKRLRLERGLSQRELAAPGVSYAYISRIEAGTRQPSVKALRRLAAKLEVSADFLETGSDLDPSAARELKLADLELQLRLGAHGEVDAPCASSSPTPTRRRPRDGAPCTRGARGAAQDHGSYAEAVTLLESALEAQPFDPVSLVDIYAQRRRYAGPGGRAARSSCWAISRRGQRR